VQILRCRKPEHPAEVQLSRSRLEQVVTANDLTHTLIGIIDDNREVVGRRPISPSDHEVVDDAGALAGETVDEGLRDAFGPHPQRRDPSLRLPFVPG
jgi:hypothetical protein